MVETWVKNITESVMGGAPFAIGDIVPHPDGFDVKIEDGKYWGSRGLSNHWSFRRVDADKQPYGEQMHGYGWSVAAVLAAREAKPKIDVHLDTKFFIENNVIPFMEGHNLVGEFSGLARFHRTYPEDWATPAKSAGWSRTVDEAGTPGFVNEHGGDIEYARDWRSLGELHDLEQVKLSTDDVATHLVSDLMAEFLMKKGENVFAIGHDSNAWVDTQKIENLLEHPLLLEAKSEIYEPYQEAKAAAAAPSI